MSPDVIPSTKTAQAVDTRNREIEIQTQGLINGHRIDLGLPPAKMHNLLKLNSKSHSDNMAAGIVGFGHYGFKKRYRDLNKVLDVAGYGENLAYNRAQDPAMKAFNQWLHSESHRRNMEGKMYTHCGLSVSPGDNGFFYFTLILVSLL